MWIVTGWPDPGLPRSATVRRRTGRLTSRAAGLRSTRSTSASPPSAIRVHNGPNATSSKKIIAISADGMNRAAEMKKIAPASAATTAGNGIGARRRAGNIVAATETSRYALVPPLGHLSLAGR